MIQTFNAGFWHVLMDLFLQILIWTFVVFMGVYQILEGFDIHIPVPRKHFEYFLPVYIAIVLLAIAIPSFLKYYKSS